MSLRSDCPVGFSQTRNSLKVSQPCGLKNDLLCSRPSRACRHLENSKLGHLRIAHCVRWVAWLYQKTSLVLYHWVTQASSTGLREAFTRPATLDKPGRLGARSLHSSRHTGQARSTGLSEVPPPESLTPSFLYHPFSLTVSQFGSYLTPPFTSHQTPQENRTRGQNHLTDLTAQSWKCRVSTMSRCVCRN